MFSVDNFYNFFSSNYGWNKTKNLIMTFQPHGSKDLHDLRSFGISADFFEVLESKSINPNKIIMHDQEPLFLSYLDTYRNALVNQKKMSYFSDSSKMLHESMIKYPAQMTNIDFFKRAAGIKPGNITIICHSERNSADINELQDDGFIECYYWWHGMIARDWFRHWQYYDDLKPRDNSMASKRFLLYARDCTGSRTYRKQVIDHCRKYQDKILHSWNGDHVDSSYSAKISLPDASDSAIHIVAETLFDTTKIYLTEKVFKPMVMSQPFILFGPPKSLDYLQSYGFKTFGECWNEDYDNEHDPDVRMSKLLDLLDYLESLTEPEFQMIYLKALPIIKYNRDRFYSSDFQNVLIQEMCVNMERALLEQYQRHQNSLYNKSSTDGNDV